MVTENAEIDRVAPSTNSRSSGIDKEASGVTPEVAELQANIERTRADLAHTVDKLTAKLDVKTRLRKAGSQARANANQQLRTLRSRAPELHGQADPKAVSIAAGVLAVGIAALVVLVWRRNHAPSRWGRH